MKKYSDIIIVLTIMAVMSVGYIFGMNSFFKNVCADDFDYEESEIYEEYAELEAEDEEFRNSFSNSNLENKNDLTNSEGNVIVIMEDEEAIEESMSHEEIIKAELELAVVDKITMIDSYEDGNWYCYYLYSDGDVYVVTIKNEHVDVSCMLN